MANKCPECKSPRVLFSLWFRDPKTNLDMYALYCKICYYLSTFESSLNPFKGFKKHVGTSRGRMIDNSKKELMELNLPNAIYDAVIQDKK